MQAERENEIAVKELQRVQAQLSKDMKRAVGAEKRLLEIEKMSARELEMESYRRGVFTSHIDII